MDKVRERDLKIGTAFWDSHCTRECWVQLESYDADSDVWWGMYETADIGPLDPGDLHYEEQSTIFKEEQ